VKAGLLAIGDELVSGAIVDTNSAWLAQRLIHLGYRVVSVQVVPDDVARIEVALLRMAEESDLVIVTGGLGPTADDLTRQALAEALGEELVSDEMALRAMKERYAQRGIALPDENLVQAMRPMSASMIPNEQGTAPGLSVMVGNARVYVLPGVPFEMRGMWEAQIESEISTRVGSARSVKIETVHCIGMPESRIGRVLADLMERGREPVIGTLPCETVVTCRITASGDTDEVGEVGEVERFIESTAQEIESRLKPYVFGRGEMTPARSVTQRLITSGKTLTTAESCTGGLLGALITEEPGVSECYIGGWQTYSNKMKVQMLGVEPAVLEEHGAVSHQTAEQMAIGAQRRAGSDYTVSITGIAGPDGGTDDKPVGTVFIALCIGDDPNGARVIVKRFMFSGERQVIRRCAANSALAMLHLSLVNNGEVPPMSWEVSGGDR